MRALGETHIKWEIMASMVETISIGETVGNYLSLVKPRQTALLTCLGICSMFAANPRAPLHIALMVTFCEVLPSDRATGGVNVYIRGCGWD